MKSKAMIVVMILSISSFPISCASTAGKTELTPSQARWSLAKKSLGFGAGFVSGGLFHEVGHFTVAKLEGMKNVRLHPTKVTYEYKPYDTYEYNEYDRIKRRNIAAAGFAADVLSSEILLASDKYFPKDNSFVLGWLFWTIFEPVSYTLRHELSSDGCGDLKNLEETGVNARVVEGALLAHGALTVYRLYRKKEVPLFIKVTRDEIGIGLRWEW